MRLSIGIQTISVLNIDGTEGGATKLSYPDLTIESMNLVRLLTGIQ